jgi:undecaprenyl-diphosphatase
MNAFEALNQSLFLWINADSATSQYSIAVATLVADDFIYFIPTLLVALWLRGDEAQRSMAIKACLVAALGVGVNQFIGLIWQHPRPFVIGLGHSWIPHVADSSFPSDHVTVFAGIAVTLLRDGAARLGLATVLIGLCVAWARIYLGVHFPFDMVGAIGVAIGCFAVRSPLWRRVGSLVTGTLEQIYRTLMSYPIATGWFRG